MQETAVNIPGIIFAWQQKAVVCLTVIVKVGINRIILLVRKA